MIERPVLVALAFLTATAAHGQHDPIYDQPFNGIEAYYVTDDCFIGGVYGNAVDDVTLDGGTIRAMSVWGFHYYGDDEVDFRIQIYAQTSEGGPGELLQETLVEGVEAVRDDDAGTDVWYCEIDPFPVEPGRTYMIGAQAVCTYFWRWHTGDGNGDPFWLRFDNSYPYEDPWYDGEDHPEGPFYEDLSMVLYGDLPATPIRSTSWSGLKVLYRSDPR